MKNTMMISRLKKAAATTGAALLFATVPAAAQYAPEQPNPYYEGQPGYATQPAIDPYYAQTQARYFAPQELDGLVSRIALYPDPLLAQVLAAATFPNDVLAAAQFASQYRGYNADQVADMIARSPLPWDPAVQALVPFPDVLDMMARDMNWTAQLGQAFLSQRNELMDAVQRMRYAAQRYGYLNGSAQMRVYADAGYIRIMPYDPAMIYVPMYDPYVVFAPPRHGFYVGTAIRFGHGFSLGLTFGNWGWGGRFDWHRHDVWVHDRLWDRNWSNRNAYVMNPGRWNGGRTVVVNNRTTVIENNGYRGGGRNGGFNNGYRNQAPVVNDNRVVNNNYGGFRNAPVQDNNNRNWNRGNQTSAPVQDNGNRGWNRSNQPNAPVQDNNNRGWNRGGPSNAPVVDNGRNRNRGGQEPAFNNRAIVENRSRAVETRREAPAGNNNGGFNRGGGEERGHGGGRRR